MDEPNKAKEKYAHLTVEEKLLRLASFYRNKEEAVLQFFTRQRAEGVHLLQDSHIDNLLETAEELSSLPQRLKYYKVQRRGSGYIAVDYFAASSELEMREFLEDNRLNGYDLGTLKKITYDQVKILAPLLPGFGLLENSFRVKNWILLDDGTHHLGFVCNDITE